MKKRIFLLLLILFSIFTLSFSAAAENVPGAIAGDLSWTFDEDTGTLTVSGNGYMFFISNPEWSHLKNKITKVVITEGLVSVGPGAFFECKNLKSVSLAKSVAHINEAAFHNCTSLTDIDLKHVKSIGMYAFRECTGLTEITIPDGVTDIGDYAFTSCTGLRTVTFHDKLKSIGDAAFNGCTGLTSITVPDSVETICKNAFGNCTNLTEVKLGSGLKTLQNAFSRCTKLKTITIPDQVALIDAFTFKGCTALVEITFGAGVTQFNGNALDDCTNLKKIYFLGKPPQFQYNAFKDLTVEVCYWGGITEWEKVSVHTGNVTFTPVFCENHTVSPLDARTPTCTQEGLTEGGGCSVCKKILTPQQPIPKAPHTYGNWMTNNDAQTQKKFPKKRICSVCGYTEYAEADQQQAPKPNDTQATVPTDPSPTVPDLPFESTPAPTVPQQAEENLPIRNPLETESQTNPTVPDIPKDTNSSKNHFLFVGIGVVLVGLAAAGIIFLKSRKK